MKLASTQPLGLSETKRVRTVDFCLTHFPKRSFFRNVSPYFTVVIEMSEVQQWHTAKRVERTINALKENGFEAVYASTKTDALKEVLNRVPKNALIGVGGSITVRELGLIDALSPRGHRVAEHWSSDLAPDERMAIRRQDALAS